MSDQLREIVRDDPRFATEAYLFVFEALDYTVRIKYGEGPYSPEEVRGQHVTGQDLLEGIRQFGLETFGRLGATVFRSWGVQQGEHFGDIVFNLIDEGLMGRQDSDSPHDFAGGYGDRTFEDLFEVRPVFEYFPESDEWKASYDNALPG